MDKIMSENEYFLINNLEFIFSNIFHTILLNLSRSILLLDHLIILTIKDM